MLREMAEALEVCSVKMPIALVFEDLHWSEHCTMDLLGMLARRREQAQLLILGTYRPADVIVTGHPLPALKQDLHSRRLCEEIRFRRWPRRFIDVPMEPLSSWSMWRMTWLAVECYGSATGVWR